MRERIEKDLRRETTDHKVERNRSRVAHLVSATWRGRVGLDRLIRSVVLNETENHLVVISKM